MSFFLLQMWKKWDIFLKTISEGGESLQKTFILEYRLWKGNEQFTPLYYYEHIELEQIIARRECEFYVKNGVTYKQVSSAIEGDICVIYVEIYEEGPIETETYSNDESMRVEIRELNSLKNHPLVKTLRFSTHMEILHMIGSTFIFVDEDEWLRDSAEIDEDRMVYVFYGTPTGIQWKE